MIPWPDLNPRKLFLDVDLEELRASIKQDGLIEPLGVKLNEEEPHWIFAGERRWRAADGVLQELPVHVRDIEEATARRLALSENIQRSNLTAIEEAWGIQSYLEASGATQKKLGRELGKTQAWVSNRLRLLRLPKDLQAMVQEGKLNASQARDLILPFSVIPDEAWDVLSKAVAKALKRTKPKAGEQLSDDQVQTAVAKVAVAMSGWLDRPMWGAEDESVFKTTTRIRDWKSAPKGSVVTYRYSSSSWEARSSRCFNEDWWIEAMRKAENREQERIQKMQELEDQEGPADFVWDPKDGPIPVDIEVPWDYHHGVFEPENPRSSHHHGTLYPVAPIDENGQQVKDDAYAIEWRITADVTAIPAELLVLKLQDETDYRQPAVICLEEEVYEAAREKLVATVDRTIKRRIRKQLKMDLEASADCEWSWASALALFSSVDHQTVLRWADDLGFTLTDPQEGREHDWRLPSSTRQASRATELLERLSAVTPIQMQQLVNLVMWRFENGRFSTDENIERAVRQEIRMKMHRALEKKVDFELPTYQPERR